MHRKVVTVLFCDVTGSTSLGDSMDPEALRALLARYFDRMKTIVERHGGTVEKFIGDAVMAVFGVPVVHEDDALRAVRAAAEMRDVLPELGVQARIGLTTGEVVTGTEERLATGDAVNVAARLEHAAQPGEVLVGQPTLALVRDAVDVEPVAPFELKGKSEPVLAYRLMGVHAAPERRHDSSFVGRHQELAVLRQAWEQAQIEQRCQLVTLIGDAGVGKSRLVAEFLSGVDATVVRGRCLPYGEGITYWPVVEVLKQVAVAPSDPAAADAVRAVLRQTDATASAEDIAWAFRKTLEEAAAARPLVVVFDDVHWGEETFLDLIEHLALLSAGAPILLLCIARLELTERRPTWPVTFRLEPLGQDDVDRLIPERIRGDLRQRITRAAGGNPLFVGEMVAMAGEAGSDVAVPPTLHAVLAARLDQLETEERSVLERGAVEGEIFHRGAVQALTPAESHVTPRLAALVRKELIRPEKPQVVGEDGFRFRHLLIRDAAYDALPKATRAELHERFAAWLEEHGAALVELDEILGYHLEQACRYHAELGLSAEGELAGAARARLTSAGRRALRGQDYRAAVSLLERAASLVPADTVDLVLETDLVDSLFWGGRPSEAVERAELFAARAAALGDRVAELCGRIEAAQARSSLEPHGATEQLATLVEEGIAVFESARADVALCSAYRALATVANIRAQMDAALDAYERAALHARKAGLPHQLIGFRDMARFFGTTPVSARLAWHDAQDPAELRSYWIRSRRATGLAMLGRIDEARSALAELQAEAAERGGMAVVATGEAQLDVELMFGNADAAVARGQEVCAALEAIGDQGFLSTSAGRLARAFYADGRLDEADAWAGRSAELGASDDVITQMLWRQARAKVLARRAEHAEAEQLAREAVALAETTDMINAQGEAYEDLAEVLSLGGHASEAGDAFAQALARYERKENLVMAERMRERLTALREQTPA